MDTKVLWVDHLCASSALYLASASFRRPEIGEVRYLRLGGQGRRTARILRAAGILRASILPAPLPAPFSLGDMHSPNGSSLRYQVEEDVLRMATAIVAQLDSHHPLAKLLEGHLPRDKVLYFLEKSLVEELYDPIMLAHVAAWHRDNVEEMRGLDHILLIKGQWLSCLGPYLEEYGIRLQGYSTLVQRSAYLYVAFRLLRSLARVVRAVLGACLRSRGEVSEKGGLPVIAVQYADGADLRQRSDYFWYPGSGLDPRQVLVYFDRPDTPATEEIVTLIEGLGMGWVVAQRTATQIPGSKPWAGDWFCVRSLLRGLGQSLRLAASLLAHPRPEKVWQWERLDRMLGLVGWWEAFFRAHKARAHIHTIDTGPQIVAQALAMEWAGGLSVGYHWSHYSCVGARHSRPQDVYFCWGPHYEPYLRGERSRVGYVVYSGQLSMYAYGARAGAEPVHKTLRARGAEYVICLFDSSFSDEAHYSRAMMVHFYTAFLREMLQDSQLGLIIKPKNVDNIERLPETAALLEQAVSTGRCLVLSHQRSPAEAARGADMAVGLGINSAVMEAVLLGVPGVHCDLTCKGDHPFYRWGYERVVFDDLSRMMEALRVHRRDRSKHPLLGDHSPVLRQIDPFQDGRGAQRLGLYLRWLMEGFSRGATPGEALQEANANYRSQFGAEMVVPFGQQEETAVANLVSRA